jgi:3-dehydroquinate synthase
MIPPMADGVLSVAVEVAGHAYRVEIGAGLLAGTGERIRAMLPARRATIISDRAVAALYGERLGQSLLAAGIEYSLLTVPPGDASKSLAVAAELYDELALLRHARDEPVIALGGGMVGDLAGFVAATWMRGVPVIQCPTTTEAAIDAAVGGKTALNHASGKNLIGAFHQPRLVRVDTDCLATLDDRDFAAGLAESVKHAVVADAVFLDWQEQQVEPINSRRPDIIAELIRRNCAIKAAVVAADERETSAQGVGRAALNFGHTIGHAIEAAAGYRLRHGEAVALGMRAELALAEECAGLRPGDRGRVEQLLAGLRVAAPERPPAGRVMSLLGHDKKTRGGRLRLVVPSGLGAVQWLEAPSPEVLRRAIEHVLPAGG